MSAFKLWNEYDEGLTPSALVDSFADEEELHDLIWSNLDILPLSGSPRLTPLKKEARIRKGYADILAIESGGRPVIIEVKLARNNESYSKIVSQILYYGTFLRGLTVKQLRKKCKIGKGVSIFQAVKKSDPSVPYSEEEFYDRLKSYLERGEARLVMALDRARPELGRVAAYVNEFTNPDLIIELVEIPKFDVNGTLVYPARQIALSVDAADDDAQFSHAPREMIEHPGAQAFRKAVKSIYGDELLGKCENAIVWMEKLETVAPDAEVRSWTDSEGMHPALDARIKGKGRGFRSCLARIVVDIRGPAICMYRHRFRKYAPNSIEDIEAAIKPIPLGSGNHAYDISDRLLNALTKAYEEAS